MNRENFFLFYFSSVFFLSMRKVFFSSMMIIIICKWRLVDEEYIDDELTKKQNPIVICLNSKRPVFMRKKVIKSCKFSLFLCFKKKKDC